MTDSFSVRDVLARGLGRAASLVGDPYDVYRPRGIGNPLDTANLFMRMPVLLDDVPSSDSMVPGAQVLAASFDGISARVGDYLKGPRGTLFIATLPARRRPTCVLTNTVVDVCQSRGPDQAGLNSYGGVTASSLEYRLRQWPGRGELRGAKRGQLPVDRAKSIWSFWFPPTPVPISAGDILQARAGRYLVKLAEATESGWKLIASGSEV